MFTITTEASLSVYKSISRYSLSYPSGYIWNSLGDACVRRDDIGEYKWTTRTTLIQTSEALTAWRNFMKSFNCTTAPVKAPPVEIRRKDNYIINLVRNHAPGRVHKEYNSTFQDCIFYGLNRERFLDKSRVNFTMVDESNAFVVDIRGVYIVPLDFIPNWIFWVLKKWFTFKERLNDNKS